MLKKFFNRKKIRIVRRPKEIEINDVFLDSLSEEKDLIKDRKIELPLEQNKLFLFFLAIILVLFFFWAETFYFQIVKGSFYQQLALDNKTRIRLIRPDRGVFYDKNGRQLVWNHSSFDLICDQRDMPFRKEEKERMIRELANILNTDYQTLQEKFEKAVSYQVLIKENLDQNLLVKFSLKSEELEGCYLEENEIRDYLEGPVLSHILGYLAKISPEEFKARENYSISDYIGKTGLEKFYEDILRGKPGLLVIEKDSLGRKRGEYQVQEPEAGASLKLWIDFDLQKKATETLAKSLKNVESPAGAVVILDVKTGGVLSLVSLPTYDNNLFSRGISQKEYQELIRNKNRPLYNRAIAGLYPSGSTIKPLIASAGLEEKIITEKTVINDDKGFISVPNPYNPEIVYVFKDWKIHGLTDVKKAIAESCNVFFYLVGGGYKNFKGLGIEKINHYLSLFNWGKKTGIDLPNEKPGLIPNPEWKKEYKKEIWYPGDTYHLSIGQGDILVTPIEVATAFVAIANNGILYKPQLVKEIIDSRTKKPVKEIKPKIVRSGFIQEKYLKIVREGMRQAVSSPRGSSYILNDLPVKVAAKTGTAQFGVKGKYHSWVTVFAPYENPEIVITVLVEKVPEGKMAALPVAKEILEWYYTKSKFKNQNSK